MQTTKPAEAPPVGQPPPAARTSETKPTPAQVAPNGDIVVLGVSKSNDEKAKKALSDLPGLFTDKGFQVLLFTPTSQDDGATNMLVLRVEGALLVKVAMKLGMPVRSEADYSIYHRTTIATLLMSLVRKLLSPHYTYKEMSLVHEPDSLDRVINARDPTLIMQYCGSEIALYFAWLAYYTRLLVLPSVAGLVLIVHKVASGHDDDSICTPIFNVLLCLWGTLLLEGWKRHNATLAYKWGILNKPEAVSGRQEEGTQESDAAKTDSALFLYGVSLPVNVAILAGLIRMMLYFVWLSDNALELYGRKSWMQYLPMVLYSVVPPTAQAMYSFVVVFLNDREGHATREESHAALQLKLFAFQFVNNYCSLFYIAFWQQDLVRLRSMLASLLVTKQIVGNLLELGMPVINSWISDYKQERDRREAEEEKASSNGDAAKGANSSSSLPRRQSSLSSGLSSSPTSAEGRVEAFCRGLVVSAYSKWEGSGASDKAKEKKEKVKKAKEEAKDYAVENSTVEEVVLAELGFDAYDIAAEHTEILVQFGYVTMFAVAFPLAPILALLNNIWEARLDILKLKVVRRPTPVMARSLGGWATALEVMSFTAVLTNCLLMARTSKSSFQQLTPEPLHFLLDTFYGRVLVALSVEHVLLAFKYMLSALIDDVPQNIRDELRREEMASREDMFKSRRSIMAGSSMGARPFATPTSGRAGPGGPAGPAVGEGPTAYEQLGSQFLSGEIPAFSPLLFLPIIALPYLIMWLRLSAWWVLPLSFFWLSYLHNIKTRKENRSGMQLAADPQVIKLITQHLPPWYFDADLEKCTWMSLVVAKMWNAVSGMTEKIVIECVQPILDSSCPTFINRLHLMKCNLGTIAPVVTGVRYVTSPEEVVRLDVHLSWAGNPDIVLEVGYKGAPLVLELSQIQFKGKIRVELNPLVPQIPGFGAILCTFMEDPFVNFSFKVGTLDVMAMGAPDMSIADVVANIIRENVLRGFMLYPHSLVIPMLDEIDAEKLRAPAPVGLLQVTLISAKNLIIGDIKTSDPYVKILYGPDQKFKSTVKKTTLNPVWNEDFTINIFDRSQHVYFYVRDYDLVGKHDSLGTYKIKVEDILPLKPLELDLELNDVKSGSLQVRLFYTPCKREGEDDEDDEGDLDSDGLGDFGGRYDLDDESLMDEDDGEQRSRSSVGGEEGGAGRLRRSSSSRNPQDFGSGGGSGVTAGVLQVDGLVLRGYTAKSSLMAPRKVCIQLAVGNTAYRSSYAKAPCINPLFQDHFAFQILEKGGIGNSTTVLGMRSIELSSLCKRATRIDQDWSIEAKGKVYQVHMVTTYSQALDSRSASNASNQG